MSKSTTDTPYNYKYFDSSVYGLEPFVSGSPRVNECAKDFTALGLDGIPIKLSDFKGKRIILETGSLTCPMFGGNIEGMNRVAEQFADEHTVFLMLYVREAHPGGKTPAHQSQEDKIGVAKRTAELTHPNRVYLVDDVKGTIHREWGEFPNSLWLINEAGRVTFRSDWNDWEMLQQILEAPNVESFIEDLGEHHDNSKNPIKLMIWVLRKAGWRAIWDLVSQGVPMIMRHREANAFYADKKFVRGDGHDQGSCW
jgi:hypothetical protein